MNIGGLQPVTLLDYPQKLAAIVFASGCNMRCPFCYNYKLVLPEHFDKAKLYEEAEVTAFLKKRKKYLDGLVITGGEPTLQKDLPEWLAKMKKIGYDIKLDTNGLLPEVIKQLIDDKLVDYIAMDIKGPLCKYDKLSGAKSDGIIESIEIIMSSGLPYEFRSTLVKNLHTKKDISEMAEMISGADLYYLQNYGGAMPLAGKDFSGASFTSEEMEQFQKLTKTKVKVCEIR